MSDEIYNSSKRTRASGEVLNYLLREFETNHNPSAEQRKEISDRTNMSEKAVRIWFQNRRAKMRKNERQGRQSESIDSSRSNSVNVRERRKYLSFDLNDKYCFIDCTSLSVGSWQRVKSGYHEESALKQDLINLSPFTVNKVMENFDLLVIVSKKNLEINYFFSAMSENSKILFRIFYPIASILSCSLLDNNIDKECSEVRVTLSHQPKFSVNFYNGVNSSSNQWSICSDFSEGQQVSSAHGDSAIPHVLVGTKDSICFLNDFILEKNQQHQANYMINDTVSPSINQVEHMDSINQPESHYFSNQNSDEEMREDDFNYDAVEETGINPSVPIWNADNELKANGLSLLGQFTSNTSPVSLGSDITNQKKPEINSFHYNEMFSANTPDFLNSSATPNIILSTTPGNMDEDSRSNQHVHNHSPYQNVTNNEPFEPVPTDQTFDFPVVNEYSGLDHSNHSPADNLDSFIDYNYP